MTEFSENQIFIVTGASSGLGQATTLLLNRQGATVVAIARNKKKLIETKEKAKNTKKIFIESKDLTNDIDNLPAYIKFLKDKYGKFSGMAYCAGISEIKPAKIQDYNNLINIFNINYFAPIMMAKGLADKRNNIGESTSIVFISSIAALSCDKGHLGYAGSKAALSASMKVLAKECSKNKIRLNCVQPSNIKTPMILSLGDNYEESQKEKYPFGFGEPDDVANLICYLLSTKAKFISGQNYIIDSGGVM